MSTIYEALEKAEKDRTQKVFGERDPTEHKIARGVISLPSKSFALPAYPMFQSGSLAAEQFRKLRSYLSKIQPMSTILVTSALQGEGKSFVSANLAMGIAFDLDLHALLVECDLRNPSLSRHFGYKEGRGLSDYLSGNAGIPELLVKTNLDKLSILPAGTPKEHPAELLASNKMAELIEEMKVRYSDRVIILDATPILATAEAESLVQMVDGILLVIRAGQTPREIVQQTLSVLGKEKIIGVVLNYIEFKSSGLFKRYFGSNGYYYNYGYGPNRKPTEENRGWNKIMKKIGMSKHLMVS
jgi:protein-tyrosine kinase